MTERDETIALAHKILDTPNKDPDSDECMLARQFLRSIEVMGYSKNDDVRSGKTYKHYPTDGFGVYGWPEFKAFCDRLGFAWEQPTTRLTIVINMHEMVRIIHQYRGQDLNKDNPKDTTTLHNKTFRTVQPPEYNPLNRMSVDIPKYNHPTWNQEIIQSICKARDKLFDLCKYGPFILVYSAANTKLKYRLTDLYSKGPPIDRRVIEQQREDEIKIEKQYDPNFDESKIPSAEDQYQAAVKQQRTMTVIDRIAKLDGLYTLEIQEGLLVNMWLINLGG